MLENALQAALRPPQALRHTAEPALLLGAGGWLGSALLEQLSSGAFTPVGAWVRQPLRSAQRGLLGLDDAALAALPPRWQGACAFVVLERDGLARARTAVFGEPTAEQLPALAARLLAGGVRRLVLVLPHAPGSLPAALQHGFADGLEQQLAGLGFAQLLIVRSSRHAERRASGWMQRLADFWWAQLRWLLPDDERPLRAVALARVVVTAARLLRDQPGGVHLLPQPLASRAAQAPEGIEAHLRAALTMPA